MLACRRNSLGANVSSRSSRSIACVDAEGKYWCRSAGRAGPGDREQRQRHESTGSKVGAEARRRQQVRRARQPWTWQATTCRPSVALFQPSEHSASEGRRAAAARTPPTPRRRAVHAGGHSEVFSSRTPAPAQQARCADGRALASFGGRRACRPGVQAGAHSPPLGKYGIDAR